MSPEAVCDQHKLESTFCSQAKKKKAPQVVLICFLFLWQILPREIIQIKNLKQKHRKKWPKAVFYTVFFLEGGSFSQPKKIKASYAEGNGSFQTPIFSNLS